MKSKRILVVDGDNLYRETLIRQLQAYEEFDVVGCRSSRDAIEQVRRSYWDAILVEAELPDVDGRELCRLMRAQGVWSPIVMMSSSGTDAETILGLESGANDYITKPISLSVLLARLRAHMREYTQSGNGRFTVGPYTFVPGSKLLFEEATGTRVSLTAKESAILRILCQSGDRPVSCHVLLDRVWGYGANVTTHTLQAHIYRLRQKIERDPSNARVLVTGPDGYRIEASGPDIALAQDRVVRRRTMDDEMRMGAD